MKNLIKLAILCGLGSVIATLQAHAQDRVPAAPQSGFYGGVSLRDAGVAKPGVDLTSLASSWAKFGSVMDEGSGSQSLLVGGYRFANDVAVEAAFTRSDSTALPLGRGMGLTLGAPDDAQPGRSNADVYTSYNFAPAFSLFGRVGYKQVDALPAYLALASSTVTAGRQGVNYGVGLRYDMSPTLGLKLEYARFGRFAFDTFSGAFPESDQVQIGVQYRF